MQLHDEQNNNILSDIASMKQSVKELDSKIAGLFSCMDSIHDELNKTTSSSLSIAVPTTTLTPNNGGDAKPSIVSQPGSISKYANAVTKNLNYTVKTAVAETLRKQCKDNRVKATVAIYGLAKGGNDSVDASELFNKLKCNVVYCTK